MCKTKEDFPRPTLATALDAVIGGIMAGESTDEAHQNAELSQTSLCFFLEINKSIRTTPIVLLTSYCAIAQYELHHFRHFFLSN
jgi:tryptophan synthase alpha subunit